ncbi:transposase, partial [Ursidibacter arcticus]|uniref:transposase n=1 Tax=Ursidibacter arcticus TaxID=1524965 RepID=UPI0019671092
AAQMGNRVKNMIAPMIYQNTMTSCLFEKWFKDMLLPTLNQLDRPSIIILDNAKFHRMKHLQEIINDSIKTNTDANSINNTNDKRHKHIILPLPPYSPELNAIEPSWATIKQWLRSHLFEFETIKQGLMGYFGVN